MALTSWIAGLAGIMAIAAAGPLPEDARLAYDAGRFSDAMGIWDQLSHQGNTEAEYGLGLLNDLGNGMPEDPQAAFFWYERAGSAGLPKAQFNVAAMYDAGRGVARDQAAAATWFARAAAHGHGRAAYALALLYLHGEGVPKNTDAASAWLRVAMQNGVPAANDRLKGLPTTTDGHPEPVSPAWPKKDATLPGDPDDVELVWMPPRSMAGVRYDVEVASLDGTDPTIVEDRLVAQTAILVRLPSRDSFYVWKVDTVSAEGTRISGQWSWFSNGQSKRSLPTLGMRER